MSDEPTQARNCPGDEAGAAQLARLREQGNASERTVLF